MIACRMCHRCRFRRDFLLWHIQICTHTRVATKKSPVRSIRSEKSYIYFYMNYIVWVNESKQFYRTHASVSVCMFVRTTKHTNGVKFSERKWKWINQFAHIPISARIQAVVIKIYIGNLVSRNREKTKTKTNLKRHCVSAQRSEFETQDK